MRTTQSKRLSTLSAVRTFLDDHADRLPGVNGSKARHALDELLNGLHVFSTEQEVNKLAALGETQRYQSLRRILVHHHIAPIVAIAQSVLVRDPGLRVFSMPRGNPSPLQLAAMARGMAAAVAPHAAVFIACGLADDFVEQLRNAVDAMLASQRERHKRTTRRQGATIGIPIELRAAGTVVRVIGVLVRKDARGDVTLLARWNAIAAPRRITASASVTALPAPAAIAALPGPNIKLLARGPTAPEVPSAREHGALAAFLSPLSRLRTHKRPA